MTLAVLWLAFISLSRFIRGISAKTAIFGIGSQKEHQHSLAYPCTFPPFPTRQEPSIMACMRSTESTNGHVSAQFAVLGLAHLLVSGNLWVHSQT
ncbi:hypothetical protein BKA63DRAFT_77786 [Paraphoma chrysanthemicola]|nr:hypothetical protein BKA63DRAFT_77786 [Paraphoma chrysanthemicola]